MTPAYSIVIPVFNGAKSLAELIGRTVSVLEQAGKTFEIIVVDDYSQDNSWEVIKELKSRFGGRIKGIRLAKNFGQHNATLCGIKHASGEFMITLDDDLEFAPEDIPLLIAQQQQSHSDVVYGIRASARFSLIRKLFTLIIKKMVRLVNGKNTARGSSFRLMRASLAGDLLKNARYFSVIDEFILWHTALISYVQVPSYASKRSGSRYSFWKLSMLVIDVIFFSSILPLRLVTLLGGVLICVNFVIGGFILYRKVFSTIPVEGYTSLIVSILFSTGIIIFSLGVIAEYISKLLKTSYDQPAFREAEVL